MRVSLSVLGVALVFCLAIRAQALPDWAAALNVPEGCVADAKRVVKISKRTAYQTIDLKRKGASDKPLSPDVIDLTIRSPLSDIDPDFDYDFCGRISIRLNPPKSKPKPGICLFPEPIYMPILLRRYDAFLISKPCDTVGCGKFGQRVLVRFDKNKEIEYEFNTVHVDAVAYSRSVDYMKLAALMDQITEGSDTR